MTQFSKDIPTLLASVPRVKIIAGATLYFKISVSLDILMFSPMLGPATWDQDLLPPLDIQSLLHWEVGTHSFFSSLRKFSYKDKTNVNVRSWKITIITTLFVVLHSYFNGNIFISLYEYYMNIILYEYNMHWFDQGDIFWDISRRRRSLLFLVIFLLRGMLAAVGDGRGLAVTQLFSEPAGSRLGSVVWALWLCSPALQQSCNGPLTVNMSWTHSA